MGTDADTDVNLGPGTDSGCSRVPPPVTPRNARARVPAARLTAFLCAAASCALVASAPSRALAETAVLLPSVGATAELATKAESELRRFLVARRDTIVQPAIFFRAVEIVTRERVVPQGEQLLRTLDMIEADYSVGFAFTAQRDGIVVIKLERTNRESGEVTSWTVGVRRTQQTSTGVVALICWLETGGACGLGGPPRQSQTVIQRVRPPIPPRAAPPPAPPDAPPAPPRAQPAPPPPAPPRPSPSGPESPRVAVLPPAAHRAVRDTAEMLRERLEEAVDSRSLQRVPNARVDQVVTRVLRLRDTGDLPQQLRAGGALEATHVLAIVVQPAGRDFALRVDLVDQESGERVSREAVVSGEELLPRTGTLAAELLERVVPPGRGPAPAPPVRPPEPPPQGGAPPPPAGPPSGPVPRRETERGAQVDVFSGRVGASETVVEEGMGGGIDRRTTERGAQADLGEGTFGVRERVVEEGEGLYREQSTGLEAGGSGVGVSAQGVERRRVPLRSNPIGFGIGAALVTGEIMDTGFFGIGAGAGLAMLLAKFPEREGSVFGLGLRANATFTYVSAGDFEDTQFGFQGSTTVFYWSMSENDDLSVSGWGAKGGLGINYANEDFGFGPLIGLDFPSVNPGSTSYRSWNLFGIILPMENAFIAFIGLALEFM